MADERKEYARNYENCCIGIPVKGIKRAAIIVGLSEGGLIGTRLVGNKTYKETAHNFSYEELRTLGIPIIPASGYFNAEVYDVRPWITAMFVRLSPDRQFRKSLAADHKTVLTSINSSEFFTDKWTKLAEDAAGSGYLFDNKVLAHSMAQGGGRNLVTLRQAATMVEGGEHHTVAFSKFFCFGLRKGYQVPVMYYNNDLIGVYDNGAVWARSEVMHLKDFFNKRWGVELLSLSNWKKKAI